MSNFPHIKSNTTAMQWQEPGACIDPARLSHSPALNSSQCHGVTPGCIGNVDEADGGGEEPIQSFSGNPEVLLEWVALRILRASGAVRTVTHRLPPPASACFERGSWPCSRSLVLSVGTESVLLQDRGIRALDYRCPLWFCPIESDRRSSSIPGSPRGRIDVLAIRQVNMLRKADLRFRQSSRTYPFTRWRR